MFPGIIDTILSSPPTARGYVPTIEYDFWEGYLKGTDRAERSPLGLFCISTFLRSWV